MNNDELQKAIDDITRDNAAPTTQVSAENEALADELAGAADGTAVPPVPAVDAAASFDVPAAPAPAVPATPSMPPMPDAPVPQAAAEPAEEPVEEPVAPVADKPAAVKTGDLAGVAEAAMKELFPLLDKVEMSVEEKFDICMKVDDDGALVKALEYAKKFSDETAKANALLKIIEATK